MSPKKLFFLGLFPALFFQLIGSFFYFVLFAQDGNGSIVYGIIKILIFSWPLFFLFRVSFPKMEGDTKYTKSLLWGTLSGLVILGVGMFIFFLYEEFFREFYQPIYEKTVAMGFLEHYILVAIFISLFHSLLEEYYWRFFLFRGLLIRFSPVWAAVISSIGFSLHHFVILHEYFSWWLTLLLGFAVFCGGLIWCWIYYRSKSILGPWISHIFVDAGILFIGWMILFG